MTYTLPSGSVISHAELLKAPSFTGHMHAHTNTHLGAGNAIDLKGIGFSLFHMAGDYFRWDTSVMCVCVCVYTTHSPLVPTM